MKISVVIPAYNAEKHIARAIDSVLAQTRPADEIIVVDDGSSDTTADVVKSFGDKVIILQQENAGVSVARNAGIAASTGDWIAFLDADDEWFPKKLEYQTKHLSRNPDLQWTYSNFYQKLPEDGTLKIAHVSSKLTEILAGREFFEDYLISYVNHGHAWTGTIIIHRNVFDSVGMFEPGMKRAQDNDLWYRIAYLYPRVGYLPEPLAIYHLDTLGSSTKVNDSVDFMMDLVQRHEELSKQSDRDGAFRPCVTQMVQAWTRECIDLKRYADTKKLTIQFSEYLPNRFRREIRFRLIFPPLTEPIAFFVWKIKKKCQKR